MWLKICVGLVAIALGLLIHLQPDLLEVAQDYLISLQEPSTSPSLEEALSTAWDTIITAPAQHWGKVAVG